MGEAKIKADRPIIYDTSEVPVRGEPLSPIIWHGRQWAVTTYGLEQRNGAYVIEAERLAKDLRSARPYSWIAHLADTKTWVDLDDFATAFFIACSAHRVQLSKADINLLLEHFATRCDARERRHSRVA